MVAQMLHMTNEPEIPSTDNIEPGSGMVLLDRRATIDEVAHSMQISHGSAYEMMQNKLGFHEFCARWIPKQLTEVHKQTRVDICQKKFDRYGNERDIFLDRIITSDEKLAHHYEPESKWQSMEWKQPQ